MTETESINQTFLEIMESLSPREPQCQSENCASGLVTCSHKAVVQVTHEACDSPSREICANALIFNHGRMSAGMTCLYCLNQGHHTFASDCWKFTAL